MEYEVLDRKKAAIFLNCSERTLDRLTDLPRFKVTARRIGFRKSDLIAYVERRTESAPA